MPALSGETVDPLADVVLNGEAGSGKHAEAVEVADERPVGVAHIVACCGNFKRLLEERGVDANEKRRLALSGGHQARVKARAASGTGRFDGEVGVAAVEGGRWELPRFLGEESDSLPSGAPDRRRGCDDLGADAVAERRALRLRSRKARRASPAARR